jgi:hypothetical protein
MWIQEKRVLFAERSREGYPLLLKVPPLAKNNRIYCLQLLIIVHIL